MKNFIKKWGQSHEEICTNLELDPNTSDDILMLDFFFIEKYSVWLPKNNTFYTDKEQTQADKLKN